MKSLLHRTESTGQTAAAQGWLAVLTTAVDNLIITGLPFGNQQLRWSMGSGGYRVDTPVPIRI